jgi:hypothetical protein
MKVSGFTFIKNAVKYDYPIVEAIKSILSLCDEFIVSLGNSEDETKELILSINSPKIKIFDSIWNENLRENGQVLADETNKALQNVSADSDWAFYIQGDEIVHEKYLNNIKEAMLKWKDISNVEGLLFKYLHFYASYNYVGDSRRWYRNEIRIIRPNTGINSYLDAQGFRKNGKKLNVKPIDAYIYHYGWVKSPLTQFQKNIYFQTLWHPDSDIEKWIKQNSNGNKIYDYSNIDSIKEFTNTHPEVMKKRVSEQNWEIAFDVNRKNYSTVRYILYLIERFTGWRIGEYKNYKKI